ncbi:hypothetical protein KR067_008899, partial [Drosophila pandora]
MTRSLLRPYLAPPVILRRSMAKKPSNKPSNTPRPPKDPPDDPPYKPACVSHEGFDVPAFVSPTSFRQFSGPDEKLGPGAGKAEVYKNAQYFGYHRYSFTDLVNQATLMRDARDADAGVQASLEVDEDPEIAHDLEAMKNLEKECDKILQRQAKEEDEKCRIAEEKALEEMSEEELKVWCQQKEALIKEQEKKKKKEEKVKGGKSLESMSSEELVEWCKQKEAEIRKKEEEKNRNAALKKKEEALMKMCEEAELKRKCIEEQVKKECEKKACEEAEQKKKCQEAEAKKI